MTNAAACVKVRKKEIALCRRVSVSVGIYVVRP